jgi:hypothetical protein
MYEAKIPYPMSWTEWGVDKRIILLDLLNINFTHMRNIDRDFLILEFGGLSSGQTEVFRWVLDPTYPLKFYILDNNYGKRTLNLFNQFWQWRFGVNQN